MNFLNIKRKFWSILFPVSVLITACQIFIPNPGSVADHTPPILTLDSVTNGQEVGSPYTLQGIVSDAGSGVYEVRVSIDSGVFKPVSISNGIWYTNISISNYGVVTNKVYAEDNDGNVSVTNLVWVSRTPTPSVIFTSPINNSTVTESNIIVNGTSSMDLPYHIVKVQVSINGGTWSNVQGTLNWSNSFTLISGTNNFYARAISDNDKTNVSAPLKIIYKPLPTVNITSPADQTITNATSILVSGTSWVTLPQIISKVQIKVNSGNWIDADGTTNWSKVISLAKRTNTIFARTITDGNSTNISESRTIYGPFAGTLKFQVKVLPPAQNLYDSISGYTNAIYVVGGLNSANLTVNGTNLSDWVPDDPTPQLQYLSNNIYQLVTHYRTSTPLTLNYKYVNGTPGLGGSWNNVEMTTNRGNVNNRLIDIPAADADIIATNLGTILVPSGINDVDPNGIQYWASTDPTYNAVNVTIVLNVTNIAILWTAYSGDYGFMGSIPQLSGSGAGIWDYANPKTATITTNGLGNLNASCQITYSGLPYFYYKLVGQTNSGIRQEFNPTHPLSIPIEKRAGGIMTNFATFQGWDGEI